MNKYEDALDAVTCGHLDTTDLDPYLDAIKDALQKQIVQKSGNVQPAWIPVTEQLPEPYELVLISIISRNGCGEPATYETMAWIEKGEWVVPGDNLYKGEKIAYWMPLPEPPKSAETI